MKNQFWSSWSCQNRDNKNHHWTNNKTNIQKTNSNLKFLKSKTRPNSDFEKKNQIQSNKRKGTKSTEHTNQQEKRTRAIKMKIYSFHFIVYIVARFYIFYYFIQTRINLPQQISSDPIKSSGFDQKNFKIMKSNPKTAQRTTATTATIQTYCNWSSNSSNSIQIHPLFSEIDRDCHSESEDNSTKQNRIKKGQMVKRL